MQQSEVYRQRRLRFMEAISGGAAVICSGPQLEDHSGSEIKYRPRNDFYYLTGFAEPESVCVLIPEHAEHRYVLFVPPRDPDQEAWNGRRAGVEGAIEEYHADAAFSNADLDEELPKLIADVDALYYALGEDEAFDARLLHWFCDAARRRANTGKGPNALIDPRELLYEQRLIKDAHEISLMRRAAEISAEAHLAAMRHVSPGMYEYEIQAIIEQTFYACQARPAFPTICGSGPNGTILHYVQNNRKIQDGDLLLIDAGADYGCYAGDITRTMPANGRFSDTQREIYEIVLRANLEAISQIGPGKPVDLFHQRAVEVIVDGLLDLGLLKGDRQTLIEEKKYHSFYRHGTGHWLGMAVHDVGKKKDKGETCVFCPNMVTTVEPGLYIADGMEDVDPRYWGIGVRIEDDVLVTESGAEVLTSAVPKQIADIEAVMA